MRSIKSRFIRAFAAVAVVCSWPAHAGYVYTSIDYPGAAVTQVFGVNNSGQAVGSGFDGFGGLVATFSYDSKRGTYTPLAQAPSSLSTNALAINEAGVMAGGVSYDGITESGFVRSKQGAYTVFSHPGWENIEARGISNTGLVSGFATNNSGPGSVAFIYDPANHTFVDFLPSPITIAHGISANGQVVGSVPLGAGVACTGCPAGSYGFLRATSGAITLFRVNGQPTAARGISDSGLVTGRVFDPSSGHDKGFVVSLSGASYQSIAVSVADLLEVPGAVSTIPEGITNSGDIVGVWTDAGGGFHGFIATSKGKK